MKALIHSMGILLLVIGLASCTDTPNKRFELSELDRFNEECSATLALPVKESELIFFLETRGLTLYKSRPIENRLDSGDDVFPPKKTSYQGKLAFDHAVVVICGSVNEGWALSRSRRYAFYVDTDKMIRHVEERSVLSLRK
jgi:hypothetical protein